MPFIVAPNGQVFDQNDRYNAHVYNNALRQIVEEPNFLERTIGDPLARMCRTEKASEIGRYINGLFGRNVTLRDRAENGFWLALQPIWLGGQALLFYVKIELAINTLIAQSDHPKAYSILKEVLIGLAVKWFANDPSKQKKLTDEIIPLVLQKIIEQQVYQALHLLYNELKALAPSPDENENRLDDIINGLEQYIPHLRDILNNEFVQIGAYFSGGQVVSRPCAALVNRFWGQA